MSKPLKGIKVIEIAQEIQGPFAGLFLSDLGAEITKVENRETGDLSRWLLAGMLGGPQLKNANVSHYFTAMNRGKRSITVDLKKKAGVEVVKRLVATHDVLLTNYRPGVLDRLGLGYEDVRKLNSKSSMRRRVRGVRGVHGSHGRVRYARAGGKRPDVQNRDAVGSATGGGRGDCGSDRSADAGGGRDGGAVRT
jgi:hypothetical protein